MFQYKVVPAPRRGEKAKGAKSSEERFAIALMRVMNELGAEGWEYLRADTLPCEERVGLTGTKATFHHLLVFRRALAIEASTEAPAVQSLLPVAEGNPPARLLGAASAPAGNAPAVGSTKSDLAAE